MRSKLFPLLLLPAAAFAQLDDPTPKHLVGARSLALSPDGKRLAFTYRGDVWVVGSGGGKAEAVTTNVEMDDNAVWSPDGKWIAFSSNRNGNWDIYVVPSEGGESKRLTWYTGADTPRDWSPDGKYILYNTTRTDVHNGLFLLDVKSTAMRPVFLDNMGVSDPEFSPDGKEILYNRLGFTWSRPRYQGSAASQIWRYDRNSNKRMLVRSTGQQHIWPSYAGDGKRIYAVTVTEKTPSSSNIDKPIPRNVDNVNRTPNVYEIDLNGKARRLTDYVGTPVRFLTVSDAGLLAYECEGAIHTMAAGEKPKRINITANIDEKTATEERLILSNGVDNGQLDPKGERIAFEVRGELWMVPVKKGKGPNADDATQLTDYAGSDKNPIWHPAGTSLFFVSDRGGAEQIWKLDPATQKAELFVKSEFDQGGLKITPDKKHLSYWTQGPDGGLFIVPVDGGEPKKVVKDRNNPAYYSWNLENYSWSPDSRYVAYTKLLVGGGFNYWDSQQNIFVTDTTTGETHNVTKLNVEHTAPEWSKDGRFLYFRSTREGGGLYVLPLTQEEARNTELELKFEKPTAPVKVEIEFPDSETRIRKLASQNVSGNIYSDPNNGDIYFLSEGDVWKVNYSGEEPKKLTNGGGIGRFIPTDGETFLVFKEGKLHTMNFRKSGDLTNVAFRADWLRNVRKEREAALREFWRLYNRAFYDPGMHGRDWASIRPRYEPLLDSVGHRNEMATVLNMMVGELEGSHTEAGPAPGNPGSQSSAHPGFTIDYSHTGLGLKVLDVPKGAPGSYKKTKIEPGEYVIAINGRDVRADEYLYRDVLNEQGGREITLLVNSKPERAGAREVKYRALRGGEWNDINYRNRIEARRKYVEQKSGGKLTYLHIAGMGGGNFETFNREAWQYAQGKQGVIIDVRNNGGGNIADQLLDILERRPQMQYRPRDGDVYTAPGTAWSFPTVVMHAETSMSNAEMFPAAVKARKIGTLVGKQTPGYVIYTYEMRLVDGSSARMPTAGVYRTDGSPLENNGQMPDVEVDITPEEYFSGRDPQLDKAIEILLKQVR